MIIARRGLLPAFTAGGPALYRTYSLFRNGCLRPDPSRRNPAAYLMGSFNGCQRLNGFSLVVEDVEDGKELCYLENLLRNF